MHLIVGGSKGREVFIHRLYAPPLKPINSSGGVPLSPEHFGAFPFAIRTESCFPSAYLEQMPDFGNRDGLVGVWLWRL